MAVLSVKSDAAAPSMYSRGEYYPPEYYRRRGLAAKQRAAQSSHPGVKEAFQDVARHWLALAEPPANVPAGGRDALSQSVELLSDNGRKITD